MPSVQRLFLDCDEVSVSRSYLERIIPLNVLSWQVQEINCFPVRLVTWEESPVGYFKLVGDDELVSLGILSCARKSALRRIRSDEPIDVKPR